MFNIEEFLEQSGDPSKWHRKTKKILKKLKKCNRISFYMNNTIVKGEIRDDWKFENKSKILKKYKNCRDERNVLGGRDKKYVY